MTGHVKYKVPVPFFFVKGATEKHQIYRIQHPKGSVVMLSEEENDSLIETLELLSIPGLLKSLNRSVNQMNTGDTYSMDEVFEDE